MKDPAFLFYSNDFLSGTFLMSDEQVGQYIKLLCLQHQKGHLKEKDMLNICKTYDEDIFSKFIKDEEGNYYNKRLEEEIIRRKNYSESRRNNRNKAKEKKDNQEEKTYEEDMNNICNSYEQHMETETETITENINITEIENENKKGNEKKQNKFNEIIEIYNTYCTNLSQVQKLTEKRKTAINKLLKEIDIEQFRDICIIANQSDFLTGDNDRNWKADFDFIIRPDKAVSILEGKYNFKKRDKMDGFRELWEEARLEDEQAGNNTNNNAFGW